VFYSCSLFSKHGETALINAAENGYLAIAKLLIQAGAAIDGLNKVSFEFTEFTHMHIQ
jgi:ankyrin repeat protein